MPCRDAVKTSTEVPALLACCTPGTPAWGTDRASHEPAAGLLAGWCCSLLIKSCLPDVVSVALLRCISDCLAELLVADAGEAELLTLEGSPDWSSADALLLLLPADPRCAGCSWLLLLLADCSAGWRRMTGTAPCRPAEMGRAPAAGSPLAPPLSADGARPGNLAPALPTCRPSASKLRASKDLQSSSATAHHQLSCCQQGRLSVCQMLSGRQRPCCWRDQLETDFCAACSGPAPRFLCCAFGRIVSGTYVDLLTGPTDLPDKQHTSSLALQLTTHCPGLHRNVHTLQPCIQQIRGYRLRNQ